MRVERYQHGVPSWVELSTPDFDVTQRFYSQLFGWQIEPGPAEFGGYTMAALHGAAVAGINPQLAPGQPPAWSTYVDVERCDETVARVSAGRGSVLAGPVDIADAGRMAVVADPEGAVLGLWEAHGHAGATLVNEPGAWTWSELLCEDPDAARRFYEAVFEWSGRTTGEGAAAYTEWLVEGRSVAGMMRKPAELPAGLPSLWSVYFAVSDAREATDRLEAFGGSVRRPVAEIAVGRFSVVADPTGAVFNLFEVRS